MADRRPVRWQAMLAGIAWLLVLALSPWWIDAPLLLGVMLVLLMRIERLRPHAGLFRLALHWGLAGTLLAVVRGIGPGLLTWTVALLGALAGYTLLAGLDGWITRRSEPSGTPVRQTTTGAEADVSWPALAVRPAGPPVLMIELCRPDWHDHAAGLQDNTGVAVQCIRDTPGRCRYVLADGRLLLSAPSRACLSPKGLWLAAQDQRLLVLWDIRRDRAHRLRRWRLCGWRDEQPWLSRRGTDLPVSLAEAMGEDA